VLLSCQIGLTASPSNPKSVMGNRMYRIIIAAIIASLAVPALAQDKSEANKAEEQKKKESDEIDRAYKNMVKNTTHGQPAKKTERWDPWGSIRR
jgi:hypothetical protein